MKKLPNPSMQEDIPSQPNQEKSAVNVVFKRMLESQNPSSPLPFRTLVRNASDLSSWQKVVRHHIRTQAASRDVPDELAMLEKLVRNAMNKALQTSKESLEKA